MENLYSYLLLQTNDTIKYLKKLEKKTGKLKSFNDIEYFKEFLKENHSKSLINYFIEDLEITNGSIINYSNQLLGWIISFVGIMITISMGIFVFIGNTGAKYIDSKEGGINLIKSAKLFFYEIMDVAILTFLFVVILIFLTNYLFNRNRHKYIKLLKSIDFDK
jgi:ABC-type multidrug transport system fused ATPase/permease subunit